MTRRHKGTLYSVCTPDGHTETARPRRPPDSLPGSLISRPNKDLTSATPLADATFWELVLRFCPARAPHPRHATYTTKSPSWLAGRKLSLIFQGLMNH